MKINLAQINKQPISFQILLIFIVVLVGYLIWLFLYLQIFGVYTVAVIKEAHPTTEGIDFTYSFNYTDKEYSGSFAGAGEKVGDKYFVLFSETNPNKSLLQYHKLVPDCLKDSINVVWNKVPNCHN